MKNVFFLILMIGIMFSFTQNISSQVVIGTEEAGVSGSLLQIKEKKSITDDAANSSRGIAFPRVKLTHKDELYPMLLQTPASEYDATTNPPIADYSDPVKREALKKSHTGLVVYNTNAAGELSVGLSEWNGKEWTSFQEKKTGDATFGPVTCSDITVYGAYEKGKHVNGSNYLNITVDVTKTGGYTIIAKSKQGGLVNGYYFYASGVALEEGAMTLTVPCQGSPLGFVETSPGVFGKDDLVITGLSAQEMTCTGKVEVVSPVANYGIFCETVKFEGTYVAKRALTSANKITLAVDALQEGSFHFSTPVTNGISFSGSGTLEKGRQTITLTGTGTPTATEDFSITINSTGSDARSLCTAMVPITLPGVTYAVIGSNLSAYNWKTAARKKALNETGSTAFSSSPGAKVKVLSFEQVWGEDITTAARAVYAFQNAARTPDIILYFAHDTPPSGVLIDSLKDYVNRGGVLIYATANNTAADANNLISGIFGSQYGNVARNNGTLAPAPREGALSTNDSFLINELPYDPVINGPFGNLGGKFWGEENTGSVHVRELPPNSVQVCSMHNWAHNADKDQASSIVWYNTVKNFFYFGDSTGATSSSLLSTTLAYAAFFESNTGSPLSKPFGYYWGTLSAGDVTVYNSALELNAIAWAVKKAVTNGINPR